MGCSISCKRPSSKSPKLKNNIIRIAHLNGHVTQLDYPATVAEVIGNPPSQFLFTRDQLLTNTVNPLKPDAVLEAGKVYFLLPHSLFDSNVSPMDLVLISGRLASAAKNNRPEPKSKRRSKTGSILANSVEKENDQRSLRSRSWKPILATIREKSFNRRSESELLQENVEG